MTIPMNEKLSGMMQLSSVMLAVQDVLDSIWKPMVQSNAIHNPHRTTMTSLYGKDTLKRFTGSLLDACNEGIVFNTVDDSFSMALLADQAVDAIRAGHEDIMKALSIYQQPYGNYDTVRFSAQAHYLASVRTMGLLNGMRMIATDGSSNLPVCDDGVIRRMSALGPATIQRLVRGMKGLTDDVYESTFGPSSGITLESLSKLLCRYADNGDIGKAVFVSELLNFVKTNEYMDSNGHDWSIRDIDAMSDIPFDIWLMDWRMRHGFPHDVAN